MHCTPGHLLRSEQLYWKWGWGGGGGGRTDCPPCLVPCGRGRRSEAQASPGGAACRGQHAGASGELHQAAQSLGSFHSHLGGWVLE